jgi:hypothetical protein
VEKEIRMVFILEGSMPLKEFILLKEKVDGNIALSHIGRSRACLHVQTRFPEEVEAWIVNLGYTILNR